MNTNIHFYHLMKTGGRSLIQSFISDASGITDIDELNKLYKESCDHNLINYDYIISGHGAQGSFGTEKYTFSTSHFNLDFFMDKLPKDVFTLTIFRHPYDRMLSLYKEALRGINGSIPCDLTSFYSYVKCVIHYSKGHCNMRRFFGCDFDCAVKNLKHISYIIFTDTYESDLKELNKIIDTNLKVFYYGKAPNEVVISDDKKEAVMDLIKDDIKFYNTAKEIQNENRATYASKGKIKP